MRPLGGGEVPGGEGALESCAGMALRGHERTFSYQGDVLRCAVPRTDRGSVTRPRAFPDARASNRPGGRGGMARDSTEDRGKPRRPPRTTVGSDEDGFRSHDPVTPARRRVPGRTPRRSRRRSPAYSPPRSQRLRCGLAQAAASFERDSHRSRRDLEPKVIKQIPSLIEQLPDVAQLDIDLEALQFPRIGRSRVVEG